MVATGVIKPRSSGFENVIYVGRSSLVRFGEALPEKEPKHKALSAESGDEFQMAVQEALRSSKTVSLKSVLKKLAGLTLDTVISTVQVGLALFMLAGIPFLHAPLWMGVATILGVTFLQNAIKKIYPHAPVHDEKKLAQFTKTLVDRYHRGVSTGEQMLQGIPLIRRTVPLYRKVALGIGHILKKGLLFLVRNVVYNSIKMNDLPPSLGGKLIFIVKIVLSQALRLLTAPFGEPGQLVNKAFTALFQLQEVKALTEGSHSAFDELDASKPLSEQASFKEGDLAESLSPSSTPTEVEASENSSTWPESKDLVPPS